MSKTKKQNQKPNTGQRARPKPNTEPKGKPEPKPKPPPRGAPERYNCAAGEAGHVEDDLWEVESLIERKVVTSGSMNKRTTKYLVRWKGYAVSRVTLCVCTQAEWLSTQSTLEYSKYSKYSGV